MPRILIIAYGNPLRCDDGVAWRAADLLEDKFAESQVEILRLHQLAPEIAHAIWHRELVLFLDAASIDNIENDRPGEVRIRELSADEIREHNPGQFTHVYSPAKILDLARELYQTTPKAFMITVTGEDFGHGESLSPKVAGVLPLLITQVECLIRQLQIGKMALESGSGARPLP